MLCVPLDAPSLRWALPGTALMLMGDPSALSRIEKCDIYELRE